MKINIFVIGPFVCYFLTFWFAPLPPDFVTQGFFASCAIIIYAVLGAVIAKFFPDTLKARNGLWLAVGSSLGATAIVSIVALREN